MPAPVVKSFAEKTGKSVKEVDKLWKKAEDIVKKDYPDIKKDSDRYYSLITGILKNMVGLKESLMNFKQFLIEGRPRLIKFLLKRNTKKWTVKNTETNKVYYLKIKEGKDDVEPLNNIHGFLVSVNAYETGHYKKTYSRVDRKRMAEKIISSGSSEIWIPENREGIIKTTWVFHDPTEKVPE